MGTDRCPRLSAHCGDALALNAAGLVLGDPFVGGEDAEKPEAFCSHIFDPFDALERVAGHVIDLCRSTSLYNLADVT